MSIIHEANPDFIHHQKNTPRSSLVREVVFGLEDGMVSTMGAVTGVAVGSGNHYMVVLSGLVVVSVESISMAVGSYLSNKSEFEMEMRKLNEERIELKNFPEEERVELVDMYVADGWPKSLAQEMANTASKDKRLFLQEMAYRELKIIPEDMSRPLANGLAMGVSYIIGGSIPLLPYLLITNVNSAVLISVTASLIGLFFIGSFTTKYSKRVWWKAGLEMFFLASAAASVGLIIGRLMDKFWLSKM